MVNADQQPNKINGPALIYSRTPATAAMGHQGQKQEATRSTKPWRNKAGSKERKSQPTSAVNPWKPSNQQTG
jgi:hypothetical protein